MEKNLIRWERIHSPLHFEGMLKRYGNVDYYLGTTTSVREDDISKWFKGDIKRC